MIRVKICGIQSLDEALWAVEAGADALGFILVPSSKRYIEPNAIQTISSHLPPFVSKVGVFADESPAKVALITRQSVLDTLQFHGGEDLELYREIPVPKIKVISFPSRTNGDSRDFIYKQPHLPHSLHGILLDSNHQGHTGGTGIPLPWQDSHFQDFLREMKKTGYPVILAGGLNPENISDAIRQTNPYGVDVSSGVESHGRKDRELIQKFISRAKSL